MHYSQNPMKGSIRSEQQNAIFFIFVCCVFKAMVPGDILEISAPRLNEVGRMAKVEEVPGLAENLVLLSKE